MEMASSLVMWCMFLEFGNLQSMDTFFGILERIYMRIIYSHKYLLFIVGASNMLGTKLLLISSTRFTTLYQIQQLRNSLTGNATQAFATTLRNNDGPGEISDSPITFSRLFNASCSESFSARSPCYFSAFPNYESFRLLSFLLSLA